MIFTNGAVAQFLGDWIGVGRVSFQLGLRNAGMDLRGKQELLEGTNLEARNFISEERRNPGIGLDSVPLSDTNLGGQLDHEPIY
jgi:hypothetical protein